MGDYDDWFDEDDSPDEDPEKKTDEQKEKQCPRCTRWLPPDAVYCAWCGGTLERKR